MYSTAYNLWAFTWLVHFELTLRLKGTEKIHTERFSKFPLIYILFSIVSLDMLMLCRLKICYNYILAQFEDICLAQRNTVMTRFAWKFSFHFISQSAKLLNWANSILGVLPGSQIIIWVKLANRLPLIMIGHINTQTEITTLYMYIDKMMFI